MFGKRKNPDSPQMESQPQKKADGKADTLDPDLLIEKITEAVSKAEKNDFKKSILSGIISGISVALITALVGLPVMLAKLDGRMNRLEDRIERLEGYHPVGIGQLGADVESDSNQKYDEQEARTGLIATNALIVHLNQVVENFDIPDKINSIPVGEDSEETLAYDNETGEGISAAELAEQKFLLPYKSGTDDAYFYGQFNKNGHWDGHCVINIYKNGSLERIIDAEYRDGKLVSSQQVFHYWTEYSKEKQNVWAISDREVFYSSDGSVAYSSGETNLYKRNEDFLQRFDEQELSEDDILDVIDFQFEMELDLYARYVGNTSNGRFNDDTGDAYIIYYYADKKVKTLYVGKFADGTINDTSGNAWWITEDEETPDGCYGYYKGRFKDGGVDSTAPTKGYEYNINQERIDEILAESGREFSDLVWRQVGENA